MSWAWLWMFGGTFVLDLLWAVYTKAVAAHRPMRAGLFAAVLYIIGGGLVTAYTTDHWLLLPAAIGAFMGTYAGTWWGTPVEPHGPACPDYHEDLEVPGYCEGCTRPVSEHTHCAGELLDHGENAHVPWQQGPIKAKGLPIFDIHDSEDCTCSFPGGPGPGFICNKCGGLV